jgi:FG-GAP-like repeat
MAFSKPVIASLIGVGLMTASLFSQGYQPPVFIGLGGNPTIIRAADLDDDGDQDVVVGDTAASTAIIVPNISGAFGLAVNLPLPGAPVDLAVDDFDGNGTPDIVALSAVTGQVTVYLNDGAGNYPSSTNYSAGPSLSRMLPVDIDGDGALDLLVARTDLNLVGVLLNDGSGGFINVGNATGVFAPSAFAKGDLDGDGDEDLVVASAASNVILTVRNDGTSFTPIAFVSVGAVPLDMMIADTDHDMRPDIITANTGSSTVTVLRNQGSFNFNRVDFPTLQTPIRLAVANSDNALGIDIAVTCLTASQTIVLSNDGMGNFTQTFGSLSGANPVGIVSVDINGDFAEDLCVVDVPSGSIRYMQNDGAFLPLYPGTGEDFELATGVNGAALSGLDQRSKTVAAGDAVALRMFSPSGTYVGMNALLFVQLFYRAFPPITPLAGLHVNEFGFGAILALNAPALSPIGDTLPFLFPAGFEGLSLMVQGVVPTPTAANGILVASPGYELIINP